MKRIAIIAALVLGMVPWGLAQSTTGKTAYLTLPSPAQVGSVLLPAGNYQVTHRLWPSGHFLEFARVTESGYGYLGMPINPEREVLATVPCTSQPLAQKVRKTALEQDGARIVQLQIKGEQVAHNF